jgi:serine phosphatase RsbU (regulator of sigma subunit)
MGESLGEYTSPMRLRYKLLLVTEIVLLVAVLALLLPLRASMREQIVTDIQRELATIAANTALYIDADLHQQAVLDGAADSQPRRTLRAQLREAQQVNGLAPQHMYTLARDGGQARLAVTTDQRIAGEPYPASGAPMPPLLRKVFESASVETTDLYADDAGKWMSAYAPIISSAGEVVAVLEVHRSADDYFGRYHEVTMLTLVIGFIALAISSLLGWHVLQRAVLRPMRAIQTGMLALGRQDFVHRVNLATGDEFEELGRTLNQLAKQLNVAKVIQRSFFPEQLPVQAGYRLAAQWVPCDATGGDYCDAFRLDEKRFAVLVADVSGHGLGASLLMSACRSALRALSTAGLSPGQLMARLDALLTGDLTNGRFITMIFGIFEDDGTFTYSNAGHGPTMMLRGGQITALATHRPPLGVQIDLDEDPQSVVALEPGDRVFLASDGLAEAMNAEAAQFGTQRIAETVADASLDCQQVVDRLYEQLLAHCDGPSQTDDVTMLCVDRVRAMV